MNCPKFTSIIVEHIAIDFCYCSKTECGWQGTISQQRRIVFLESLLQEIEEHARCTSTNTDFMYGYNEAIDDVAEIARKVHE